MRSRHAEAEFTTPESISITDASECWIQEAKMKRTGPAVDLIERTIRQWQLRESQG
jgi:hypothetical protein